MPLPPQAAADSPPLPEATALAAAGLSPQSARAGLALLRRLTGRTAGAADGNARAAKWRAALLRLHLRYERLRLGHDAQSLALLRRAAAAGRPAPALSVGQWLFLLDFCRKNA